MAPVETNFGGPDGRLTGKHRGHYLERARGGVGLLTLEAFAVHPGGRLQAKQLGLWSDDFVPDLRDLVAKLQALGSRVCIQLSHAGRQTTTKITGAQPVCPSEFISHSGERARELTAEEIDELVEQFAEGARRAQDAGADAIELHGSGGYLICQFLSPYTNKRQDRYGGDLKGRQRFLLDIVSKIQERVGRDYPLICRISGDEFVDGGFTIQEAKVIAQRLEASGVHAIHVYAGNSDSPRPLALPIRSIPSGCLVPLAEEVKRSVKIPVIAVGGISDPDLAEQIVATGKADMVAMARGLIADPHWPAKVLAGKDREVIRCIRCNECIDRIFTGREIACLVNPTVGREAEFAVAPAPSRKRVFIVGGGPAGMTAARFCALQGHDVTLAEKGQRLGGALLLAAKPPGKSEVLHLVEYLSHQLETLGVDVRLNCEISSRDLREAQPEVVLLATGASPLTPELPGVGLPNVALANDILSGVREAGAAPLVLGGGMVGAEVAHFLAEQGRKVKIVEMLPRIASDMGGTVRRFLLNRLSELGVEMLTGTEVVEIRPDGVVCRRGEEVFPVAADTVVLALGFKADPSLGEQLQALGIPWHPIGDCREVRKAIDAVREGAEAAIGL